MVYTFKSNFEGDIRRFSSDLELTYSRLKDKITNLYSLYDCEFIITYLDDGDNITIADNKDLEEAYKTLLLENDVLRLTVTRKQENNDIKLNSNSNNSNNSSNNNVDSLFIQLLSNQFVQQMIPQVMNSLANNPALMTSIIQTAGSALRKNNSNSDIINNSNNDSNNNNSNINSTEILNNCNNKNINLKRASPHLLNASVSNNFHTHSTDSIVATLQPIIDQQDNNNNNNNNNNNQNNNNSNSQNNNNSGNQNNNSSRITLTSSNGNESCNGSFSSSISFEMVNKENEDNQLYSTNSTSSSITSTSSASALNNININNNNNNNNSNNSSTSSTTTTTTNNNSTSQRPPSPMEKSNNNTNRLSGLPKSFLNMLPFTNAKNDKAKDESNSNNSNTAVVTGNLANVSTPPQSITPQHPTTNSNTQSPTSQSSPKQEHSLSSSPSKFSPLPPPAISHSPSNVFSHNFNNPYIYSTLPNNNNINNNNATTILPPPPTPSPNFNTTIPLQQTQPILINEQPQSQQSSPPQSNSDQLNFIKEALQISEDEAKRLLLKHNGDLDKIFGN